MIHKHVLWPVAQCIYLLIIQYRMGIDHEARDFVPATRRAAFGATWAGQRSFRAVTRNVSVVVCFKGLAK
jgi:hypothetical protein